MKIITSLNTSYTIYKLYEDILNSYVSDYYIEEHWKKLPCAWQRNLDDISMDQLSDLLDFSKSPDKIIYSLSLLCLHKLISCHAVSRIQVDISSYICTFRDNDGFMKFFWKNVKLKKRHEINIMAKLCNEMAFRTNCYYIVDVGSGLGHLSRMLSFGYGLKVLALEAVPSLTETAKEMDKTFENALNNKKIFHRKIFNTAHLNKKITCDLPAELFSKLVRNAFNVHDDNFKFGLIGLHPCGNLGSTLLKLYSNCPNIAFIAMASCCYMKLTMDPSSLNVGFPISAYCKNKAIKLSYLSCEIACHAIENYIDRLKHPEDYCKLKIHSYRAILENILVSANPDLKHSMICSVKYNDNLTFEKYCRKTLERYKLFIPENLSMFYESLINKTWKKVVAFYSIRLLLAPLVETVILLDRLLYLRESNSSCQISAAFDCKISPRNQVLIARKSNDNIQKYKQ